MSNVAGLTRENCGSGCNEKGCAITGLARCCHPLKGGLPIERLSDATVMLAYSNACAAIDVPNAYTKGTA